MTATATLADVARTDASLRAFLLLMWLFTLSLYWRRTLCILLLPFRAHSNLLLSFGTRRPDFLLTRLSSRYINPSLLLWLYSWFLTSQPLLLALDHLLLARLSYLNLSLRLNSNRLTDPFTPRLIYALV